MRDIKFRGQANDGRWVYGCLVYSKDIGPAIYFEVGAITKSFDFVYVKLESVGQYTGLKDKNGVEIYEGDILKIHYKNNPIVGVVEFYSAHEEEEGQWAVKWAKWVLADYKRKTKQDACERGYHFSIPGIREVIGNIHLNKLDATIGKGE